MFNRKLTILLLAIFCLTIEVGLGAGPVAAVGKLSDINGNWAYARIMYLVDNGAISGYPDGTFRPNNNISRAEFITIVNQAFKLKGTAEVNFRDVSPGQWYYSQIGTAIAAGYLPDYDDNLLAPQQQITREEAAYMVAHAMQLDTSEPASLSFRDTAEISWWSRDSVAAMVKAGCIKGYPDKTFRPGNPITRAEASSILYIALNPSAMTPGSGYNVQDFGARGDGATDDTDAIQNAIDYAYANGGGTVNIPDGTYLIDVGSTINLKSNIKLKLADNATLQAIPYSEDVSFVLQARNVSNISVVGGNIKGDRNSHSRAGDYGMGIGVYSCNNVYIADISISDCWGDGIYIGSNRGGQNYCQNVLIEGFNIDNVCRNGITVISAKDLTIRNGVISNTNGSRPETGIDLEPNFSEERLQNILIENLTARYNANVAILVALPNYTSSPNNPLDITIKNLDDYGSGFGEPYYFYEYYPSSTCRISVI